MANFWTVWNWWANALADFHRCPPTTCNEEQAQDLEAMLGETIAAWKVKHQIEDTE